MNYDTDLKIDETALDVECLEQPRLMMRYARHQAQCERDMEKAKERLDIKRAELDVEIRKDPEEYGLVKVTEGAIQSVIIKDSEYKKLNDEYFDAVHENRMAKGAVRSIDARKTMLETLVKLHGQQYFAGPQVPRDLTSEATKRRQQDSADEKVNIPTRRRRR